MSPPSKAGALLPAILSGIWIFAPLASTAQTSADLAIVGERLTTTILGSVPSSSTVQSHLSSLQANGSWSGINYGSTSQTNWQPLTHLDRLRLMCRAYAHPSGNLHRDAALLSGIFSAFDYWISRNSQSANWWYNQIAVPQYLGECMVLVKDELSPARKTAGLAVLQRAYVPRSTNSGTNTGQNRVDRAIAGIQRGIVADSVPIAQDAFLAIADTIVITTAEGIQRDHSYHQHGAQLYNQGYGSLFIAETLKWASLSADTGLAFPEDMRRILADYLLDGTRWMNRGRMIDYTASGRGLSRRNQSANGAGLGSLATTVMTVLPGYRTAELEALRASITAANATGIADPALSHSGAKHFWRSDFTAWHRPAGYASVKISSTRTLQPESGNGEGLQNLHLADGVNLILRTGTEYNDIMPVWNWRKLPGTTTEQASYSLKPSTDWGMAGNSTYAGGISGGRHAATAFHYNRRNVSAKKAWFFFDGGFVALGAGIDAPAAAGQVETTLNQSLLRGSVTYGAGGPPQTLAGGSATVADLQWVHHDGTGYFFNQTPASASLQAAPQTGTWQSINSNLDNNPVTRDVFALSIRHGTAFTGGSYAYTIVPGLSSEETAAYRSTLEILRNDATAQAVRDTAAGLVQGAWHAAGTISWDGGSLAANGPAMAQYESSTDAFRFAAASPEAKVTTVRLDTTGPQETWFDAFGAATSVSIGLPGGDLAGSTAALHVSREAGEDETLLRFHGSGGFTSLTADFSAPLALPGDAIFDCDDVSASFSGPVSGPASIVKRGSGTLQLAGAGVFDGPAVVQAGTFLLTGSLETPGIELEQNAILDIRRTDALTLSNLSGPGTLVQSGTGALTLAGGTAHTGDTRIEAGTLILLHPLLDDASAIHLAGGGALSLGFDGTDIVRSLTIDGIPLPPGIWGAPGSGAMYESSRISGSGRLLVASTDPREVRDLVHDTFDIGSPPTHGNDAEDSLDTAWTATGFNLSLAEDATLGTGRALAAASTGTFSHLRGAIPAQTLANPGDTLRLSFDFRYTSVPGNNVGGFRFGFFNSNGGGYAVQHGTGGSTGYALLRGPDGFGSGSNFGSIASASKSSLNDTARHHATFEIRRTDTGFTLRGAVDGVEIATSTDPPVTTVFNTVAIRNGSINAGLRIDNVRVFHETPRPPFFTVIPATKPAAIPGVPYLESLVPGDTLTFTKLDGPAWLDISAEGLLSGTPEAADLGDNLFTIRITDPHGLSMESVFIIPVADPSPPVETWRLLHFGEDAGNPAIAGDDADPDGDGWPNLIEYALGLHPLSADPSPALRLENDTLVMEFQRHVFPSDVILIPQWSADLQEWSDTGIGIDENALPLVRAVLPLPSDASRRFLRLQAVRP